MRHKFDPVRLLQSVIGYKGLPFPGMSLENAPSGGYIAATPEITTAAAPRQELVKGARLYKQDALGRWYFMPVFVRHPALRGEDHMLELENAVISITGTKEIVRTPLVGRRGTVKELISCGDYKISIAAFIHSTDGTYPAARIMRMKELFNINESVELICVLTDLLLDEGDRVVITDIQFPSTPGLEDGQVVKLECETDSTLELTLQ